jgi:hypothetical protein
VADPTKWNFRDERERAVMLVYQAIKDGVLIRPATCELCGNSPEPQIIAPPERHPYSRSRIIAHHWNGHNHPLDVWWVCCDCDLNLRGSEFHNGTITKEQARGLIEQPKRHWSEQYINAGQETN